MNGMKVIIAFVCGFVVAQGIKCMTALMRGKMALGYLMKSGGMPSGHGASFAAATTVVGLISGFNSEIFALAVCIAMIVFYDAINVRYAVGEQGKELNKILPKPLKVVEGHNIAELIVGILIGITIGVMIFYFF